MRSSHEDLDLFDQEQITRQMLWGRSVRESQWDQVQGVDYAFETL